MVRREVGLYLDLTIGKRGAGPAVELLAAVTGRMPIASVLVRSEPEEPATALAPLIEAAHRKGVVALVDRSLREARDINADGVHLPWSRNVVELVKEARKAAGAGVIVGGDAGRSRHEAMELGEAGADYVAFGIPAHVEDRARAIERQLDLVGWWSEIFEVPCVAFDVVDAQHAAHLAEVGVDYISLPVTADDPVKDVLDRLSQFDDIVLRKEAVR